MHEETIVPHGLRCQQGRYRTKGVLEAFPNHTMMACMADMELALRRANEAGLIHYRSGDASFSVQSLSR